MADFGCSRGGESAWPDGSSASVGRGRYVMGSAADEGRCSGRLTGHHSINQRLERFYETLKLVLFLQSKKKSIGASQSEISLENCSQCISVIYYYITFIFVLILPFWLAFTFWFLFSDNVVYFIKLYTIRLINAIYLFQIEVKLNNHITKYAQSYLNI